MQHDNAHISVLLAESISGLAIKPEGTYIDCTFGRGGHSGLILDNLGPNGRLIAIDRDLTAIEAAKKYAADKRFIIEHHGFADLQMIVEKHELTEKIDGILLDLGVSSPQLDEAERGFSFMKDGPLDMRMDTTRGQTAAEWIAVADVEDITWVLRTFGEEKHAWRIANAIVDEREETALTRTGQLAQLIKKTAPQREMKKHPATRSFQAIRIYINSELEQIEKVLSASLSVLATDGRLVVISFHSLEDRLVKQFMKKHSQGRKVPRGLPISEEELNKGKNLSLIGRRLKPSKDEVEENVRSRSSVLRVAQRLAR
ncbi:MULTISPECIES: 16S rRNA (cytosine(1402)-N(4))-methyltransferase RsmH [unclassified Colwellia]|jgi:16S rRNA (cytosine1402-N4)-methyltransferase|uniref:16S rRNA (cytosine(1402)-N(4))-methyltransferase RsmH n=1 Tax=unclassified Colwellia TaxID=196834 RepID=UPI0015F3B068|nr:MULTISPECIES: 16S rRNA (cytosine(1402)-N(4))-methyltransferase RsmH [unclassified Colwellia]MBA6223773.1 16S rRNA (cytosine(1402)-N(4))-methyltransferase RsmH [Colwellia sp. MB3u-45]MBA6268503.1 16S rRNA (cytosine(1402)-N(4))-methyltransferase RsmH [Colwellia sp. MB3u-43]MBA6288112.1 16S rRNA (cytosine(1402)-N(4))-methyltransferase RsmH [Colwellia sp. MB3u-4]MBA6297587.1 16S rRNA (cytosine(1402)-N(4))-methyltransferase RsmH [Colwellia sp. MB02u-9]MBA6319954.1 16S rRNA (cytosine(1402)-N(4))-